MGYCALGVVSTWTTFEVVGAQLNGKESRKEASQGGNAMTPRGQATRMQHPWRDIHLRCDSRLSVQTVTNRIFHPITDVYVSLTYGLTLHDVMIHVAVIFACLSRCVSDANLRAYRRTITCMILNVSTKTPRPLSWQSIYTLKGLRVDCTILKDLCFSVLNAPLKGVSSV